MNHIQKQSILILVQTIEAQLEAMKSLLFVDGGGFSVANRSKDKEDINYTTLEEDELITEAMTAPEDKSDILIQDLFEKAREANDRPSQ